MLRRFRALAVFGAVVSTAAVTAHAAGAKRFHHLSTFDVTTNGTEAAEIVDRTAFGKGLVYTDSETGALGFVDIRNPADPRPDGTLPLPGEPTSVAVRGPSTLWSASTPRLGTWTAYRRRARERSWW